MSVGIAAEKRRAAITLNIKDTKESPALKNNYHLKMESYMIQIFNPSWIDLTRADGQKEGRKLNSDLVKASPIIITKNPTKKHNQNEVLETNFVSPSEMPKPQRK